MDAVVKDLMENDFVPSFGYRKGRTGAEFMAIITKKGDIHKFCHPNSLLTLQEYFQDYASDATQNVGESVISKERTTIGTAPKRPWIGK